MPMEENYLILIGYLLLVYSGSESPLELLSKDRGIDGTRTNGSNPLNKELKVEASVISRSNPPSNLKKKKKTVRNMRYPEQKTKNY